MIRNLVDRQVDVATAFSALDAGLAVEASGEPGIGKTAVLRHLAHHPRAASFVDGVVYVSARHQEPGDLQQLLFEAFYESDEFCKPTEAEIRRGLQEKQALILLDDVHLPQEELEQVLEMAPRAAFVVATRERRLWREVQGLALKGLPADDAVLLLEREIERSLDATERSAAAALCAGIGGSPLRILQAASVIREQGVSLEGWDRIIRQSPIVFLMTSVDEKERRALLALAALPGVPLRALHVSAIAEMTDIEPSLTALARRGLVVSSQSRHRLADGVTDRLRRTEDLKPWANRAVTYFTAWAERHLHSQDTVLQESEVLLRVQQHAADARRSGEVLHLGRLLEGPLVAGARWGAWAVTLERCLDAAKAIGDRPAEAWALHELGSRALCLEDAGTARALLSQAAKLRELLNDHAGAAASRRNLSFVLPPVPEYSRERGRTLLSGVLDLDSLPLRDAPAPVISNPNTYSAGAVVFVVLLFAMLGSLAYWTPLTGFGPFVQASLSKAKGRMTTTPAPQQAASEPGVLHHEEPSAASSYTESVVLTDGFPLTAPEPQPPLTDTPSILIFTPRPGSITRGGPTTLCYAVSEAVQVRLEPGIGDVAPTRTLTCLRVSPARTTTYQLTAYGREGHQVSQQLVIVVR
ncbi:MAG TPA: NB-ARC domain-containing protein [Vicinamibacterales bacterium]